MSIEEQLASATSEISVLKNSLRVATETEQRCRELFDATTEMWRQDALALAAMTAENELHKSLLQPLEHSRNVCQERLTAANFKIGELTRELNIAKHNEQRTHNANARMAQELYVLTQERNRLLGE